MPLILLRPVYTPRSGRPTRSGPVRQDILWLAAKFVLGVCAGAGYNPATLSLSGGGVAGALRHDRPFAAGERQ
jgi:hypothetical protein